MPITPSQLRENIYQLLDQVLETGAPIEILRKGQLLRLMPVETTSRLDKLTPNPDYLACDPEELVHLDWSGEWRR